MNNAILITIQEFDFVRHTLDNALTRMHQSDVRLEEIR
jgi:hypothetical protein